MVSPPSIANLQSLNKEGGGSRVSSAAAPTKPVEPAEKQNILVMNSNKSETEEYTEEENLSYEMN